MSAIFSAEMPSNIALIKYMGKVSGAARNRPTNSSLSYTLRSLLSRVEIRHLNVDAVQGADEWAPLQGQDWMSPSLSEKSQARFLAHFSSLKAQWSIRGQFQVRSANNFPSDCGIASSSSSFAALTAATYQLAQAQNKNLDLSVQQLAEFSRAGSGSSIRSFLSPFVTWNENGISLADVPFTDLVHKVVIVDARKKAVSSSDAHERVRTSQLFQGRALRAEERLNELLAAFRTQDWRKAYDVTWSEFIDMHKLFQTSTPAFDYMTPKSIEVLGVVRDHWAQEKDGPLVTMDAGANVHLLYRLEQKSTAIRLQRVIEETLRVSSLGEVLL